MCCEGLPDVCVRENPEGSRAELAAVAILPLVIRAGRLMMVAPKNTSIRSELLLLLLLMFVLHWVLRVQR